MAVAVHTFRIEAIHSDGLRIYVRCPEQPSRETLISIDGSWFIDEGENAEVAPGSREHSVYHKCRRCGTSILVRATLEVTAAS